jgi:hypothetical protein
MTTPTEEVEQTSESPTGDCPECEGTVELRKKDGRVKQHKRFWGGMCEGWGKKPLPPVREFVVRGNTEWSVKVEARTADEAADLIDDIDYHWWDRQEILSYGVDEVVSKEKEHDYGLYVDERAMCQRERCGHPVAVHTGTYDWTSEERPHPRIEGACSSSLCKCRRAIEDTDLDD